MAFFAALRDAAGSSCRDAETDTWQNEDSKSQRRQRLERVGDLPGVLIEGLCADVTEGGVSQTVRSIETGEGLDQYPISRDESLDNNSFVKWKHLRWMSSRTIQNGWMGSAGDDPRPVRYGSDRETGRPPFRRMMRSQRQCFA
ncbi:hypothetical protein JC607_07400 [Paracoccus sp. IB05]|nr:hypothetical protein [Paracoccus sp. IB05]